MQWNRLGRSSLVAALVATTLLGACDRAGDSAARAGDRLDVVASFYPLAELATRVGGTRVRVTNLTPVGVEPHDGELTSRQVDQLTDADLVLFLGRDFQPAVAEVAENRGAGALDLLQHVTNFIAKGGGDGDPHFWLDPQRMTEAAAAVANALAAASPSDGELFRANATSFRTELRLLDEEFKRGLAECDRRKIVTTHAAFTYLAARYDLEQLAIAGLSPEFEPDADRLAELADRIEADGITTVFFETLVSDEVAETLARETGATAAVLDPIEGLADEDVAGGKDYAAVMRENLAALRAALGCR